MVARPIQFPHTYPAPRSLARLGAISSPRENPHLVSGLDFSRAAAFSISEVFSPCATTRSCAATPPSSRRLRPKSPCRQHRPQHKRHQRRQLRRRKQRLLLPVRHHMQRRHLVEQLHQKHKKIQILRHHGRNHPRHPPRPHQVAPVARHPRQQQRHHRDHPKHDPRRHALIRKQKSRPAGQRGHHQKKCRQPRQHPASNHPRRHHKSNANGDQADHHMYLRKKSQTYSQDHAVPSFANRSLSA